MRTPPDGASWFLIVLVRLRILSLQISSWAFVLAKSRLGHLVAGEALSTKRLLIYSERLAKYNQILRIEQELGDKAIYAGAGFRSAVEI